MFVYGPKRYRHMMSASLQVNYLPIKLNMQFAFCLSTVHTWLSIPNKLRVSIELFFLINLQLNFSLHAWQPDCFMWLSTACNNFKATLKSLLMETRTLSCVPGLVMRCLDSSLWQTFHCAAGIPQQGFNLFSHRTNLGVGQNLPSLLSSLFGLRD